ncbi:MAG: hypothetical protein WBM01_04485 [Mycobacterium sp.]
MTHASPAQGPPPQVIFLIRHAEKPVATDGATYTGMDVTGTPNPDCLIPQGWQRAGGLANLFDTAVGTMRTDLAVPGHLYSPAYSDPVKTVNHRTYETILPLSLRLGLTINNTYQEGQEAQLATAIVANDAGISPVAWEHDHIPDIAANIPVVTGVVVPTVWPGDRFDIIWCFTLAADEGAAYHFAALPELLLSGDAAA